MGERGESAGGSGSMHTWDGMIDRVMLVDRPFQ